MTDRVAAPSLRVPLQGPGAERVVGMRIGVVVSVPVAVVVPVAGRMAVVMVMVMVMVRVPVPAVVVAVVMPVPVSVVVVMVMVVPVAVAVAVVVVVVMVVMPIAMVVRGRRTGPDPFDVVVVALLGEPLLRLEAEDPLAVLAQLAVHEVRAAQGLLDALRERVEHRVVVVEVRGLDELDPGVRAATRSVCS